MLVFSVLFTIAGTLGLRSNLDVVVGSSGHLLTALAAFLVARWKGARYCFEIRDLWPATLIEMGRLRKGSLVARSMYRIERLLIERADWVVGTIPGIHDYCKGFSIDPGRVHWFTNGVELDRFKAVEVRSPGKGSPLTVCYFGSIGQPNAVDVIVDAAARLAAEGRGRDFRFRIIGDGSEREALERRCREEGLDGVEFLGRVPWAQIPATVAGSDVFVVVLRRCPGLYGFGTSLNKLPEYMTLGLPIVMAGNPPANPVREAGCGFVVEAEDADGLASALKEVAALSPEERALMGNRGREYARRHYNYTRLMAEYARMLTEKD